MDNISRIKKGVYRHSKKGHLYRVLGEAVQTETDELLVVYKPLYDSDYELFARPYDMFVDTVEIDGENKPRFEFISE